MRQSLIVYLACLVIFVGCKQKEKTEKEKVFGFIVELWNYNYNAVFHAPSPSAFLMSQCEQS